MPPLNGYIDRSGPRSVQSDNRKAVFQCGFAGLLLVALYDQHSTTESPSN